ncbi:condensation domain-containing protein, partial [Streptomyces sp. SID12488]|uniref:condensation domain-containing protein n=1 Tax=Streptomyces sp. SID12488 TaxID=2706040 RepID=UPI001EF2B1E2
MRTVPAYQISQIEARDWKQARVDRELSLMRHEFATHGPSTDQWPLFEVRAHRLGEHRFRVSLRISLLLLDAHTEALLAREFIELYRNPTSSAAKPAPRYRDHVLALTESEGSALYQRAADYWHARMPLPGAPDLPLALQPQESTSR